MLGLSLIVLVCYYDHLKSVCCICYFVYVFELCGCELFLLRLFLVCVLCDAGFDCLLCLGLLFGQVCYLVWLLFDCAVWFISCVWVC